MADTTLFLETARHAVGLACIVTRHVQSRLATIRAISKEDKSPVTIADLAAQAVIAKTLAERLPPLPLIAEEDADFLRDPKNRAHLEQALEAASLVWPNVTADKFLSAIDMGRAARDSRPAAFWTLDPIDGTKGFVRGRQYAIALAGVTLGKPILGVLGCPNLTAKSVADFDVPDPTGAGSLYSAAEGLGATVTIGCDPKGSTTAIKVKPRAEGASVVLASSIEQGHTSGALVDRATARLPEGTEVRHARLDSQCKYALVARGDADVYLRISPIESTRKECIWDHAAGVIVCQEAGMTVTDVANKPLDFGVGSKLDQNRGVLAGHPDVHAMMLEAVSKL
jgi:HAL2 family 3'(2'),5'-bisphosphate nucleotidase